MRRTGARIYQVAARFRISVAFVNKLLRRQRTTGALAALPACGGPAPRLNPASRARLLVCLGQRPDATLDEMRAALAATGGPVLSRTAGWRAVESMGWGRKKSVYATERDTERVVALRRSFVAVVQAENWMRFVFVDEVRLKYLGPVPP